MTKVDIFSGFLGAGKTTLIKKLVKESFKGQKVVLIENEFGEIGIDGSFLKESGILINELNDGCICCTLVGDFRSALAEVIEQYHPDRIIIEPSGVGKLSDVTRAVEGVAEELDLGLDAFVTVADAKRVKMYMKNFGEFYDDQISHASCVILSRTKDMDEAKLAAAVALIREKNPDAAIVTTDWDLLEGNQILAAMQGKDDFVAELRELARKNNILKADEDAAEAAEHAAEEEEEHHHHDHDDDEDKHEHHHHHDDDDDDEDEHGHHHHHGDDDDDEDEHEHHHHHDDDDDEDEHEHHHHHDDDDDDHDHEHHDHDEHEGHSHAHHHHHHHHHDGDHDADEVFQAWGVETAKKFSEAELKAALTELDSGAYGTVLRAKGIVDGGDTWYEFDMVPEECEIRPAKPDITGKLVVIGAELDSAKVAALFGC